MVDITISAIMLDTMHASAQQNAVVWKSPTVGYAFAIDSGFDFVYWKTSDAGATWSVTPVDIKAGVVTHCTIWHDEWTTGTSTDTIVHTWYLNGNSPGSDTLFYRSFDMSDDSLGSEITVIGSLSINTGGASVRSLTGGMTLSGNLAVAYRTNTTGEHGCERSDDNGATWDAVADPFDGDGDIALFTPGNTSGGDPDDFWLIYLDISANELSLKEYDESATQTFPTETSIGTVVDNLVGAFNIGCAHRISDNHAIVSAWNAFDVAGADLLVWDVGSNASITAKTNVITNEAESVECPVFINQQNDDIYVAYISGTAWGSQTQTFYQLSTDGGGTWGGEVALGVDAEDDIRNIWSGSGVGDNGGMFEPIWFNDDLNDLFTNADNAVSIAAAAVGAGIRNPFGGPMVLRNPLGA